LYKYKHHLTNVYPEKKWSRNELYIQIGDFSLIERKRLPHNVFDKQA